MPQRWTANEVADSLSESVTTIKTWADRLGIGDKTGSNERLFEERDVEALRVAKSLRAEDCGFDTITRRLDRDRDGHQKSSPFAERQAPSPVAHQLDVRALAAEVAAALRTDNALAEKYAHSAHRIAELEAEVRILSEDRNRLRLEVDTLRTELATARDRPWWRRLNRQ
jgi:DNA-binding transcriptional MerR regulator